MYEFSYARPKTIDEAVALLQADGEAKPLSGGMTLIATLKQRLAQPSTLVDLGGIPDIAGICEEGGALYIGAMTRHAEVAFSTLVRQAIPALAELAEGIGDAQVRNRGTLGGSIANNDPASDYPAALVALGATIKTTARELAAEEFFTGMFETALEEGELVVAVRFPKPKRAAYAKFPNPASRYAVVGVFVAETADGVRVAVTGAGGGVFRATEMEQALARSFTPDAIADIHLSPDEMNGDMHASAEYRAHLVTVMAKRAVQSALR
jgi:carbon-monoxide dehydrogenase medium subunit